MLYCQGTLFKRVIALGVRTKRAVHPKTCTFTVLSKEDWHHGNEYTFMQL